MAEITRDFTAFMNGNAEKTQIVTYVASKRFKEKGKPIEWEIKAIDSELDESLRRESMKRIPITGRKGQYTEELDTDKYIGKVCVASTVFPNLNNAELQDSYSVKSGESLLKKLLLVGEYAEYKAKVMEVNGFDLTFDELVDEAKN